MKLSNSKNYMVHTALYSIACTLITNSIIQGFLLESGIDKQTVMYYLSAVQAIQVCVMFLFSTVVDKLKKIMQLYSLTVLLQITMFVSLSFICIFTNLPQSTKTVIIFSAGIITNIDQAILNILTFKAPYYYLDMKKIGNIQGATGAVCGIGGVIVSSLLILFTSNFKYHSVMLVFFIIGIVLIAVSFLFILRIKYHTPELPAKNAGHKKINLFKYKPFYVLLLPNLLRGLNSGIFVATMTIGFSLGITDSGSSATLTVIMQSAYIIGSFVFSRLSAPRKNVKIAFISSIFLVVFMPLMMSGNLILFYSMYFLSSICVSFIDGSIPCVVIELVDYEYMGQFSSYRLLLHTLGISISGLVALPLIDVLGGVGTMIFSSSCQLISGTVYYLLAKNIYKKGYLN